MQLTHIFLAILSTTNGIMAYPNNADVMPMEEVDPAQVANPPAQKSSPLIIVPGDAGSQAFAKWKAHSNLPAFPLWVNLEFVLSTWVLTFLFGLTYDPVTHTTIDNELLDIQFPGWGETWSIENLDTTSHKMTQYFKNMVNRLVEDPFYVRNVTLRGAPFDFRRAPNENAQFFTNMKSLVNETYHNSGGRRVMLLGHSMGNLYILCFLRSQSAEWRKQFIRGYISISAPLAGAVKAMKLEASGDNFNIPVERPIWFRTLQRSLPSTAFLMPYPTAWGPDEPIVITPQRNYSAHDYLEFFTDIGFRNGYLMRIDTESFLDLNSPIGVDEVYCLYGNGIPTAEQLVYYPPNIIRRPFPDQTPTIVHGEGDGVVNLRSLQLCQKWPGVTCKVFPDAEHVEVVQKAPVIDYVYQILAKGDGTRN